jgi:ABC-type enterochelin transport system permease subunit
MNKITTLILDIITCIFIFAALGTNVYICYVKAAYVPALIFVALIGLFVCAIIKIRRS